MFIVKLISRKQTRHAHITPSGASILWTPKRRLATKMTRAKARQIATKARKYWHSYPVKICKVSK